MTTASRPHVLLPAAAAAGIASSLIALGFGLMAFVAGVTALSGQGAALLFAPFAAAAVALICGLLGLLPAIVWVASALFVGPPILHRLRGPARGLTLGLACTAPAFLVGRWIAESGLLGPAASTRPMVDIAVTVGGVLAGLIMIHLIRTDSIDPT